ncbi:MAG: hypothetical protein OXU20_18040 [Myxococcales bacterium]|nr:hypothetical protein [Myxococcales bacterium]MDD9971446.1 hypothetical protein [Myxococcales bacterium]
MKLPISLIYLTAVGLIACAHTSDQHHAVPKIAHHCAQLGDVTEQVAALYQSGVSQVRPIKREQFIARAIQRTHTVGAELYVPGQQGMNNVYLERMLTCHAASGMAAAHPNDPLRSGGVDDVDVAAVGSNYRIAIVGRDRSAGDAIWQRARMLQPGSTDVQVEQIGAQPLPTSL